MKNIDENCIYEEEFFYRDNKFLSKSHYWSATSFATFIIALPTTENNNIEGRILRNQDVENLWKKSNLLQNLTINPLRILKNIFKELNQTIEQLIIKLKLYWKNKQKKYRTWLLV